MRFIFIFIVFFMFCTTCYSQTLIWEREYQDEKNFIFIPLMSSLLPTIIDSEGNIVTAIDPASPYYMNSGLIKYDQNGNLLSYKSYHLPFTSMPLSIAQSENGYRMFCAITNSPIYSGYFPLIFDTNMDGDSLGTKVIYDLDSEQLYDSIGLQINEGNHRIGTIESDGKYYNASVKSVIYGSSNNNVNRNHLILTSFDLEGKIIWRKGVDTLKEGESYTVSDVKLLNSKNILLLLRKYINKEYKLQIIEFDKNGNILKKIDPLLLDKSFFPIGIEELANGDYAIVGDRHEKDTVSAKLIRLSPSGEMIKTLNMPNRNLGLGFSSMNQTPRGDLLLLGSTSILVCDSNTCNKEHQNIMFLFDSNFGYVSELAYGDTLLDNPSELRNIHFLDDNNFIAIGYKERYKFHIAKFSLKPTSVSEINKMIPNVQISPNPAYEFIAINLGAINSTLKPGVDEVLIYNVIGEKVMTVVHTPWSEQNSEQTGAFFLPPIQINISDLPTGIYFVKIGNNVNKFVKM